ncbi:hypothetical protein TNCV_4004111 [Trichonephila clavipes]|nr:hypothetical protein TNCV_4004111 [Trichonephila clavipes]
MTRPQPYRLKIQNNTEQDIMPDAKIIAAVTFDVTLPENDEDVNFEDTLQTPKISHSEGLKAVEITLQYFE